MPPAKVLVIDDDPILLQTMSQVLRQHDFEVHLCGDAEKGLELARSYHPDIILLDVLLPDSDGFIVLGKLKDSPDTHDIPVVLITGFADEAGARRAKAMNAEGYLPKPLHTEDLVRAVQERLAAAEALRNLQLRSIIPPGETQPNA